MEIQLNQQQQAGLDAMNAWLSDKDSRQITLIGWAGRGKTTLAIYWLAQLSRTVRDRVAVVAPTNRAVDVMRNKWPASVSSPNFLTIHSLFGIREVIQPDGTLKFVPQVNDRPKIGNYDYVFVDESSMVGQELLDIALSYSNEVKFIFCGDDRQLTPVGETISPALNLPGPRHILTEPVRQKAGSPILDAAECFPNYWDIQSKSTEMGSVEVIRNRGLFDNLIVDWAKNPKILEANFMKVLAWRNATVDAINNTIRCTIFGDDVPRFVEGDRIITKGPCLLDGDIMAYASEELSVDSVKLADEEIADSIIWNTYQLSCTNSRGEKVWLRVIHESCENDMNKLLKAIADYAKMQVAKGVPAKIAWSNFFELKDMFHGVQHAYALTVHRAQGGTYENTAVHISDFNANRQFDERKRLFYTACTRASHNLVVYYGTT